MTKVKVSEEIEELIEEIKAKQLKIFCRAIFAQGFEVGYYEALAQDYGMRDSILDSELEALGFEKDKIYQDYPNEEMKEALIESRINKVLENFGMDEVIKLIK